MPDKKRVNVHLYVTPICNLHCKHCYYDAWPITKTVDNLLSIQDLSYIITTLNNNYEAAFDIEGGEFFWREDIAELFKVVPANHWKTVTITTNGTVDIQVDHKYLGYLDNLRVSVEGHTDQLQKDIRGVSLEAVARTCANLQSSGIPVTLRITLHKKNYRYIIEMMNFFQGLGIKRFSLYEFQPVGRGILCEQEYRLEEHELEEVFNSLYSAPIPADKVESFKLNLSARRIPLVQQYQQELITRGYQILDLSGIPSLTINYNGNLGVCPWNIDQNIIGVFRKESFLSDIGSYIETTQLDHECDYCSAIRIGYHSLA